MAGIAKAPRSDGLPWIALSWASLFLVLAMMLILALLLAVNSFNALWPYRVERVTLADGDSFLGFRVNDDVSPEGEERIQYKVGNRDLNAGVDFRWVRALDIHLGTRPCRP